MQIFRGIAAVSDFLKKEKLLKQISELDKDITDLSAEFVHFVDTNGQLNRQEKQRLGSLLTYGLPINNQSNTGELILIAPRAGTITPWSSKATDIAHNSGLKSVNRIERGTAYYLKTSGKFNRTAVAGVLHDRMTESVLSSLNEAKTLFAEDSPRPLKVIDVLNGSKTALKVANKDLGLALADDEIDYLTKVYKQLKRNPTDVELMMFAQLNSEHCRHKIFNANWVVNGKKQPKSLFQMIRNTYEKSSIDVLSAYSDNAAVLKGGLGGRFFANPLDGTYGYHNEPIHTVIKVETHNHPTAIAPSPGAATGSGGEIRDEGATGRGAKPKMGLAGFSVSNLRIPGAEQPWETYYGKPDRITSALGIMLEAPIGAASYVNEFGRPNLMGYFRTYEQSDSNSVWGYHKPIMIAGGLGNIRQMHVKKDSMPAGTPIIVLGGPAMLIGLGGSAASSMQSGTSTESLDFASVQRANAEIEQRAQEVIDSCWALGNNNPIITIHDVGAGGLSNALPEIVNGSDLGAEFELRDLPSAETGLSPLEIWSNEAQERYVIGISKKDLNLFKQICERERCPYAVVGITTKNKQLVTTDRLYGNRPVDLPMDVLFGNPPKMTRSFSRKSVALKPLKLDKINLEDAVERVLKLPVVGSKKFLISIGDRSVGGLVSRDQMVGPWQVPVSDVAVTSLAFDTDLGEAMSMGERTPLAIINGPASARMAIGEAITNILAADIKVLADIKLSANWMAAAGIDNEDQKLFDTVSAVGQEFCPSLGLTIPVGKDSLSMRTEWQENDENKSVTSPLSLIISAFSPVRSVTKTLTPQLDVTSQTSLLLVDLGQSNSRLGGSALAQVFNQVGSDSPDVDPNILKRFYEVIQKLKQSSKILAYHDRSDGGLFTSLCEMAFASRSGLEVQIKDIPGSILERLFNEELGVVMQIKKTDEDLVIDAIRNALGGHVYSLGYPIIKQDIIIKDGQKTVYINTRAKLETWWSETSYQMQKLRDNPDCANQELDELRKDNDPGLSASSTFKPSQKRYTKRPKIAILREQGVNGHVEMAAAFDRAGFKSVDVHLSDIMSGRKSLTDFTGLVACGGFSYGDVLGAGEGWAKTIIFHKELNKDFSEFFRRQDTFSLGVCNGCQMLSGLKTLIPGAELWPTFQKNKSEQFEARLVLAKINKSPSIFFKDMENSYLPVPVAHGEGRAVFETEKQVHDAISNNLVPIQYVNNNYDITENYPSNPNGSVKGITALTTPDGRSTIMMPHPERAFMTRQLSWHPESWGEDSTWLHLFQNARNWVG